MDAVVQQLYSGGFLGPSLQALLMSLVVVTAGKREGKTSYVRRFAEHMTDSGRSVGGIASLAVTVGGRHAGYDLLDLRSGARRPLARLAAAAQIPTVGQFCFDRSAIEHGCLTVIDSVRDGLDFVVVDEVGPLELRGDGWAPALEVALRECQSGQTLALVVRASLVGQIPERFPSPLWERVHFVRAPWPSSFPTD